MSTATRLAIKEDIAEAADKTMEFASNVGAMASQAAIDAGSLVSQAAGDVSRKADNLTADAGAGIKDLGNRLGKSGPHDEMLGSVSQAVARTVREGGEYLEDAKLSGLTRDLAELIQRSPIPSVLIAAGLGWFVARKLRN